MRQNALQMGGTESTPILMETTLPAQRTETMKARRALEVPIGSGTLRNGSLYHSGSKASAIASRTVGLSTLVLATVSFPLRWPHALPMRIVERKILAGAAVAMGIALLGWLAGRASTPPETFSFDKWEQERHQRAPLLERAKVAGEAEARPAGDLDKDPSATPNIDIRF